MRKLVYIVLLSISLSQCYSDRCMYFDEIPFLLSVSNKEDKEKICSCYSENRNLFASFRDSIGYDATFEIEELLINSNVGISSIEAFSQHWNAFAKQHRETAITSEPIYNEGVICLKELLNKEIIEYDEYIEKTKTRVIEKLTKSQIKLVKSGVSKYMNFSLRNRQNFFNYEDFMLGKLAPSNVEYNQLSFEIITKHILSSEKRFGAPKKYKSKVLNIYKEVPELQSDFKNYKLIEEKLIAKLTSDKCFKRIGILRFYDLLSQTEKENAQKVNMLMNYIK